MATLPHEGDYPILYRSLPVAIGSGYRNGYLARPDRAGRFPTVLIVPDLNGLTATEKDLARRLARRGLACLAVELLAPSDRAGDPLVAYGAIDDNEAIRVLDEAREYLASEDIDWAFPDSVGVLGLEVGGRIALLLAAHRSWVRSAVVVGSPLTGDESRRFQVADLLEHIGPPVLALYGADDHLVAASSVDEAQRRNPGGSWLLYEGVGHGFADPNAEGFDTDAAEDAIHRLTEFLIATLPTAAEEVVG